MTDEWRNQAACAKNPELMFPVGEGAEAQQQVIEAVKVCLGCPVRVECLTWAMAQHPQAGIWGGTTQMQRAGMRQRARVGGAGRLRSDRIAQRREQVAWLHGRGLRPYQIASRLGVSADVVSADLQRIREAA